MASNGTPTACDAFGSGRRQLRQVQCINCTSCSVRGKGISSLPLVTKSSTDWTSIAAMLECNAARFELRPAILGEGGVQLSHRDLHGQVAEIVRALDDLGVGKGDRVAIALPAGPDLAVSFLAAAVGATAAPLNPTYLEKEFAFHLWDLSARA